MNDTDRQIGIQNTLDFCQSALNWAYNLNGVHAALEVLENVPDARAIRLLIGFVESHKDALSGRDMELCERAGQIMGKLTRELMNSASNQKTEEAEAAL